MLRAEPKRELELAPQLRRLLAALLYVVYRNYCCQCGDEDCEELADLAYSLLRVDLDSECEDGDA